MPIPEIDPVEMDVFYDCLEEFEVAPAVAESATVASVSTVGVDLAAAEAAGAAAGTAAEASGAASLSIAAGLATIGVALIAEAILAGIIAIVTEMAKAESVVIVIENRTRFPIKVLDTHVHHGKQTASISNQYIPAASDVDRANGKSVQATLAFSKDVGALFGTEGGMLLEFRDPNDTDPAKVKAAAPGSWLWFAFGWCIPQAGHNSVGVGAWFANAKDAWWALIDQPDDVRTKDEVTLNDGATSFKITSTISSASGGDIAMVVQISET